MAHWVDKYRDKAYTEANCGELYMLVAKEQFCKCIPVPIPAGQSAKRRTLLAAMQSEGRPVVIPEDGDAVLMLQGRQPHIGVFVRMNNSPYVLHAMKSVGKACVHAIYQLQRLGLDVEGFYRPL